MWHQLTQSPSTLLSWKVVALLSDEGLNMFEKQTNMFWTAVYLKAFFLVVIFHFRKFPLYFLLFFQFSFFFKSFLFFSDVIGMRNMRLNSVHWELFIVTGEKKAFFWYTYKFSRLMPIHFLNPFAPEAHIILLSAHTWTSKGNSFHLCQKTGNCSTGKRLFGKF